MAKRKQPNNDQPELPLDSTPEAATPTARGQGPGEKPFKAEPPEPVAAVVPPPPPRKKGEKVQDDQAPLAKHYRNWFLDYASYVILDRAVPHIDDGLKPVQRRVLHTLWEMDDGRFHKVANIVGATMKLHPHGDASIGAALVAIGQRA